ncbi:serine hydroxymethyltransferase [Candidatus Woesebacteria bacterium RBG_16_39_8b]|uniref:Serine hydroxymethyltransferase n=1 Tax=Candidatus Woesebacteria bacterium RBG_16_39_8b TaxID=1802482 RepID=A0A1F7X8B1_9BACT|nr:MAG: serine hydroxymethyltransferase [Candidatus Woesebacteria bacterium RBG_16_39_8b]
MSEKVFELIRLEEKRQRETLMMIPSENYASKATRSAQGSMLSNKYSEGYPGRRYYQGNKYIDEIENLAIERAKKLFGVPHANVQPYSGSPANSAVLFALLNPKDTIMGMQLSSGGHLTHGQPDITFSGKYFRSVQFGVDEKGLLDYEKIGMLAKTQKPKLLIIGTTAYPLALNWKRFAEIADSVGAWLVADVSHVAGLIVGGSYPSPVPFAHIVTTTTHKTLRGPRGAIVMVTNKGLKKDSELGKLIDKAVFPGLQGGPHDNQTAAIAVALGEALKPSFKTYGKQVVKNAKTLANELIGGGLTLIGGGTACHLMLVDLRPQALSGNVVAEALEIAAIVVNRNSVPKDAMPPYYPSGIRLGTPALTTRGMREVEMKLIAGWICEIIEYVSSYKLPDKVEARAKFVKAFKNKIAKDKLLLHIASEVGILCKKYP